ncbi:MAG: SusC/RagA family TonB-linked outer membrane protein [Muribaculaceae bacterium]|nr:SusC/RagA family TonB-linked outer membrane protein [Muribaculaceae bacterium]
MKKLLLLLVTVLTISLCASAQMRTVKGIVLDAENDEPLIGVSVTAGSGTVGVATDVDGRFAIQVPANVTHLSVSYVGFKPQTVKIGSGDITVRMLPENTLLTEVIAVAYGTATRASFTGSAAVIDAATLENAQVSNALNALSGKVSGVQINNASGAPGGDSPTILIRGISSINAGTSPLIVVDGTPFSGNMNNINPNDIASMTVLKDASSAALYGARGANGVILITTKRAKAGEATVTVDIKLGSNSRAQQDYNYIKNPAQYYETYYAALYNYRVANGASAASASAWANQNLTANNDYGLGYNMYNIPNGQALIGLNGKLNPNATLGRLVQYENAEYWLTPDNWMDAAYHNALRQEYNLSVAQGGDKTNFYLSAGYLDNAGITPQSGYKRFSGRLAADTQAKSWLKFAADMSYTHYEMDSYGSNEGESSSSGNPFAIATSIAPIYPLYMRDGNGQILRNENGQVLYDYGRYAGMTRPVFAGTNAIGDGVYNRSYSKGNALSASGSVEVKLPYGFKVTANQNLDYTEYLSTSLTNPTVS